MSDTELLPCDDAEVMRIWRECGLPEYFLGNGGSNHKLVAFAKACRSPDPMRGEMEKQLRFAVENLEGIRDGTDCVSSVIIRKSRAILAKAAQSPKPAEVPGDIIVLKVPE